jgi:hypothetical protein
MVHVYPWYAYVYLLADMVVAIPAVDRPRHRSRQWCEGGSESVGRCVLPSLSQLAAVCIRPKHTWFSVHTCALFQSESCDITLVRALDETERALIKLQLVQVGSAEPKTLQDARGAVFVDQPTTKKRVRSERAERAAQRTANKQKRRRSRGIECSN